MLDFWPECGHRHLDRTAPDRLQPTAAWWAHWLDRPELALVAESCPAEIRLHQALRAQPLRPVAEADLQALADADVRHNYRLWLQLRDGLQAAGSLEAWYCGLFAPGAGPITLPPLFIDLVVQALLRELLEVGGDAFEARAAELLFRPQRITLHDGRVLAGDRSAVDETSASGGFGSLGRLLAQAQAPLRAAQLAVLAPDNTGDYFHQASQTPARHNFLLDLTPSVPKTLAPGVSVPLALTHSGLGALARVLQRWVARLLGVAVRIQPVAKLDDVRWHLGLDAEATVLLNDLHHGATLSPARQQQLIGLMRLDFTDPADMRPAVAGQPVLLGLAMDAQHQLRLKPQNLLLNLPLADATPRRR
ncbi:MAG: hypothetical protein CFE45_16240 [Burkholderiales bacterium PBB5]|nr:MAG: hypothetical protein CFE45_16240 [Burkholderiales bacterium PBB5]